MNAYEWAGWILIVAFVAFVVAILLAAGFVGSLLGHALAGLGL